MTGSSIRTGGAVAALSLSTFTFVTTELMPVGLLSSLARDLGRTEAAVGLLVTGYAVVVVLTSVPLTLLVGRLPRRAVLVGLLAVLVVSTAASAAAPTYEVLLASRLATALAQALFWCLVVPAGTWLGQVVDWRAAFVGLSAVSLLALAGVAALLPGGAAVPAAQQRGTRPDAGRYVSLVLSTALAVTGAFAALTFVAPYLTTAGGVAAASVAAVLLVRGVAGVVGVLLVGLVADRVPGLATGAVLVLQLLALLGQGLLDAGPVAAAVSVAAAGLSLAALSTVYGASSSPPSRSGCCAPSSGWRRRVAGRGARPPRRRRHRPR